MHYFTLGFKNNPLLLEFEKKFLIQLQGIWNSVFDGPLPESEFLLFPDVHGNLLALTHMTARYEELKSALHDQYMHYLSHEQRLINPEKCIGKTRIELTDTFSNPYIDTDSHPDHIREGIHVTFGEKSFAEWESLFSGALNILQQTAPGFYDEINFLLKKILPFGISVGTHNSGSYSNVIGHITMSYPTDVDSPEIVVLEALIHEYNHNKINLILQNEVLLQNDYSEIYYSPYRPDPRTIHGIYLGLHALTAAYWVIWKAYKEGAITLEEKDKEKGVLYVLKNALSIQMLEKYALMTHLGKEFFLEMKQVHKETLGFIAGSGISPEMLNSTKQKIKSHYNETILANTGIFC